MKKLIILITVITFSVNAYSQNTFSTSKYGSTFIECFYTFKASSSIPFSQDCQDLMKQKIFDMCVTLQTRLQENRKIILLKLGAEDVKELETQLKNYQQYAGTAEVDITPGQRQSMLMWTALSKNAVEKIFIKLNK